MLHQSFHDKYLFARCVELVVMWHICVCLLCWISHYVVCLHLLVVLIHLLCDFVFVSWVASETSSHSMDEMARALMDASIFLAFMTNNYVNDENCCNLFKYARLTLHKPILLVTIGSGFEWLQSKLGILLADEVTFYLLPLLFYHFKNYYYT